MHKITAILIAMLVMVAGATSQTTWNGDRSHSHVKFAVTHLLISEVEGRFTDFSAKLQQPKDDDFTGSTLEATIKTASINTDNEGRDRHLRSDDFFNTDSFPEIRFTSTAFEKTGKDTYKITGNLTMRDVTKPVVLDAKFGGQMTDKRGNTKAGFKATTTIDRFEFGVKWAAALEAGGLVASKDIQVTMLMELNKQKPPSATEEKK